MLTISPKSTSSLPPTDTPIPHPTSTDTPPPAISNIEEKAGPFRLVTSLADVLPDPNADVRLKVPADASAWIITGQKVLRWDGQVWETVFAGEEDISAAVDDGGRLWVLRQDISEIAAWQDGQWTTYGVESGWENGTISEIGRWWAPTPWSAYISAGDLTWLPMGKDVRAFDGNQWMSYTLEDMGFPSMDLEDIGIVHILATSKNNGEVWVGECITLHQDLWVGKVCAGSMVKPGKEIKHR